jgi:hypothetical protein
MEDIMNVIFTTRKGKHLDTDEKYHLYQTTEKGMQINNISAITENKILFLLFVFIKLRF